MGLALLAAVTLFPWLTWTLLRKFWLARREVEVLQAKYGDLEMFRERLIEWKVLREPGEPGENRF